MTIVEKNDSITSLTLPYLGVDIRGEELRKSAVSILASLLKEEKHTKLCQLNFGSHSYYATLSSDDTLPFGNVELWKDKTVKELIVHLQRNKVDPHRKLFKNLKSTPHREIVDTMICFKDNLNSTFPLLKNIPALYKVAASNHNKRNIINGSEKVSKKTRLS